MSFDLSLFIKYLPFLVQAGRTIPEIVAYVNAVRDDLQQKEEWTPNAENAFIELLDAESKDSAWTPEA